MKRFLIFALLIGASFGPVSGAPDFVIVEDQIVLLTANVYMNAQSVRVELLDGNGNVQAATTTRPGNTVTFTRNSSSRQVRSIYTLTTSQECIIVDEVYNI